MERVLAAAEELAELDPDHPDPGGMVSDARAKLRDAELAARYAQGSTPQPGMLGQSSRGLHGLNRSIPASATPHVLDAARRRSSHIIRTSRPTHEALADLPNRCSTPRTCSMRRHLSCRHHGGSPTGSATDRHHAHSSRGVFLQRLNRRTKIVLAVVAACAVVAAVVVIVVTNRPDDPTQRLLALVGSDNCSPANNAHPVGFVAGVSCYEGALSSGRVFYYLVSDQAALDWNYGTSPFLPQRCPGMSSQDWHRAANPQHTEGKVGCFVQGGKPAVAWTVDSQLVFGLASGPEGGTIDQVFQWWANRYGGGQE